MYQIDTRHCTLFVQQSILFTVELVCVIEMLTVLVDQTNTLVLVHVVIGHVQNADCDIGAVVRDTLQPGKKIRPNEAHFDGTLAFLETMDMPGTKCLFQVVHYFFQGLNMNGN